MRLSAGLLSALMAASVCGLGYAQDLGSEWRSLGATETSLIFTAPGLEGTTKRFMWSRAPDFSYTLEIGIWASPSALIPKAQLMLQQLGAGYSYEGDMDIKQFIKTLTFIKNKEKSIKKKQSTSNKIGQAIYRAFSFDDFECVAFGQNFGDVSYYDVPSNFDSSDILLGFYCANPGDNLSAEAIVKVIESVGIKGVTTPSVSEGRPAAKNE